MTAENRNIARPSWVVFPKECEKSLHWLVRLCCTVVLQSPVTALCGFTKHHAEVCLVGGGASSLLGPYLGERAFRGNTCHPLLRRCYLLWPAPSVQSNFQGIKSLLWCCHGRWAASVCVCVCERVHAHDVFAKIPPSQFFTKVYVKNIIFG